MKREDAMTIVGSQQFREVVVTALEFERAGERWSSKMISGKLGRSIPNVAYYVTRLVNGPETKPTPGFAAAKPSGNPRPARGALERYYRFKPNAARELGACVAFLEEGEPKSARRGRAA